MENNRLLVFVFPFIYCTFLPYLDQCVNFFYLKWKLIFMCTIKKFPLFYFALGNEGGKRFSFCWTTCLCICLTSNWVHVNLIWIARFPSFAYEQTYVWLENRSKGAIMTFFCAFYGKFIFGLECLLRKDWLRDLRGGCDMNTNLL